MGSKSTIFDIWYRLITRFNYALIDDYQAIPASVVLSDWKEYGHGGEMVLAGLLPVVKDRANNETSLWIFCDVVQRLFSSVDMMYEPWKFPKFRDLFTNKKLLNVNLRNTYEISAVLSVIREHFEAMAIPWTDIFSIPQQREGHFLRGTKPVIYLLRNDDSSWKRILEEQLTNLRDIKVLIGRYEFERNLPNNRGILVGTSHWT